MNVSLWAGAGYGGGTAINWTNCLRTKPWVREQWAREHGLEGLDGPDFDRHLDAVWERISVTDRCSDLNGPQTLMKQGAGRLGWSFKTITRNIDESRYSPDSAGLIGFGGRTCASTPAPRWAASTSPRRAPGGAPRRPRSWTSSPTSTTATAS
jgi:hypothetical protein